MKLSEQQRTALRFINSVGHTSHYDFKKRAGVSEATIESLQARDLIDTDSRYLTGWRITDEGRLAAVREGVAGS